jgi:aconitate hydratase
MGVLPVQFVPGESRETHALTGFERYSIEGIPEAITSRVRARVRAVRADGTTKAFEVIVRIDTPQEAEYYRNGGILPYVLRQLATSAAVAH